MKPLQFSIILDKQNNFSLCEDEHPYLLPLSSHSHPHPEFFLFLEGAGEMVIGNQTFPMTTGDLLIIPPNVKHYFHCTHNDTYRRAYIFVTLKNLHTLGLDDLINIIEAGKPIMINIARSAFVSSLPQVSLLAARIIPKEARRKLFDERLIWLYFALQETLLKKRNVSQASNLVEKAIEYIQQHVEEPFTLNDIANALFVSPSYLHHVFTQQTEMSIMHFANRTKINHAIHLLRNDVPLSAVYQRCGYENYATFFRVFKRELGISPSSFKKSF